MAGCGGLLLATVPAIAAPAVASTINPHASGNFPVAAAVVLVLPPAPAAAVLVELPAPLAAEFDESPSSPPHALAINKAATTDSHRPRNSLRHTVIPAFTAD